MNPIIKRERVQVGATAPSTAPRRGHAKVASLLEVEGEVRAIELRCSCGETTVIELQYAAAQAPAEPAPTAPLPNEETQP